MLSAHASLSASGYACLSWVLLGIVFCISAQCWSLNSCVYNVAQSLKRWPFPQLVKTWFAYIRIVTTAATDASCRADPVPMVVKQTLHKPLANLGLLASWLA